MAPCSPVHLYVSYGDGGIYIPHIECLDDDILELGSQGLNSNIWSLYHIAAKLGLLGHIYTETSGLQCQNGLLVMKLCLNIVHIDHWLEMQVSLCDFIQ